MTWREWGSKLSISLNVYINIFKWLCISRLLDREVCICKIGFCCSELPKQVSILVSYPWVIIRTMLKSASMIMNFSIFLELYYKFINDLKTLINKILNKTFFIIQWLPLPLVKIFLNYFCFSICFIWCNHISRTLFM